MDVEDEAEPGNVLELEVVLTPLEVVVVDVDEVVDVEDEVVVVLGSFRCAAVVDVLVVVETFGAVVVLGRT